MGGIFERNKGKSVKPMFLSEAELDERYGTKSKLASGGDYGCGCLVFEGDVSVDGGWLGDAHFASLKGELPVEELRARWGHADIGTVVVTGNLRVRGDLAPSDRLMCLVVLGDLEARDVHIYETEVLVDGNAALRSLDDRDAYLTVRGKLAIAGE